MTQSASAYTPTSGGATVVTIADHDEGLSAVLPIGFNFAYNGKVMTHFVMSSNGWIKLGTSAGMTLPSNTYPAGGSQINVSGVIMQLDGQSALMSYDPADGDIISPFNIDLDDGVTSTLFPYTFEDSGTIGNRVCKIQWSNRKDYNGTLNNSIFSDINFQVKLYENGGLIKFSYGSFTAGPAANANSALAWSAGIGIKGSAVQDPIYGVQSAEQTLVLSKGSTTAWSGVTNGVFAMSGTVSTSNNVGAACFSVRSRNAASPYAVNTSYLPTAGQTYTFTPYSPFPVTLKYSPITVENVAGTYTDLAATGTVISTGGNFDNANSTEQAIGFNFGFGTTTVTHFILNTNGYLKLGTTGMTAPTNNLFPAATSSGAGVGALYNTSTAASTNLLVPFNMDLVAGTNTPEYRYAVTGTSPNRVCTIQWKNVRDNVAAAGGFDGGTNVQIYDNINFQVRLYENGSRIEYVYGNFASSTGTNRKLVQIGIKGLADVPNQVLAANPSSDGSYANIEWSRSLYTHLPYINLFTAGNAAARKPDVGRTIGFPLTYANDLRADIVYTLGKLPTPYANPTNIKGVVRNVGDNDFAGGGSASITLSGANSGTSSVTLPAIPAGGTAELDFGNFSPSSIGSTNVILSVPSDDNNGNNSKNWTMNVNSNTYSYKDPAASNAGGVGYNVGTGVFVAKFNSNSTNTLNSAKVDFSGSGGRQYQLVVYGDNAGVPGALRYISPVYTSPAGGGTAVLSICPSLVVSGDFYVGVRQSVAGGNVGFSYQTENPQRSGTFFETSPVANGGTNVGDPTSGWNDFAAEGLTFRLSIEALLEVASGVPNCATITSPADASVYQSRTSTLNWGAGAGNTPSTYDIYFGTSPLALNLVATNFCGNTYTPSLLNANTTYYWKVVPKNVVGPAVGCSVWSFTTAPLPTNDDCSSATIVTACGGAINGFTNNATQSLAALNCSGSENANDDVWFKFAATSVTHRIRVVPVDAILDPVIDLRSSGCPGVNLLCQNLRPAGFAEDLVATGLTPGSEYVIRVYGAGAAGTEGRFTIAVTTDGGWTGATSTDWNTASNWCDGSVPTSTSVVQIRPAANQPVLNSNASILSLAVDNGATLTLGSGVLLNVRSDGASGGTFSGGGTVSGGTIRLSTAGGNAQSVSATGTVDDIQFSNGTGLNVLNTANLKIRKSLTFPIGTTLVNNGLITLKSSASGTAYVGSFTGSTYSGTGAMAQERFIGGSARWVFLGAPVQNAALNQWSELSPSILPLNNASVFWFQETDSSRTVVNGGYVAERNGWRVPTSLVNNINPGSLRGYRAYVRSGFLTGSTPVVSVSGTPYVGTVTATLTKTAGQYYGGGYNLIANPYMSPIDFDLVTKGGGVNNAFFVYNGSVGNYQVYVGAAGFNEGVALNAPGPNPNHIPSSQAFFVRTATNGSTITFSESNKVANNTANFYRSGPVADRLRIAARDAAGHQDEAVIRFRQGATEGFDTQADAGALGADYISVSSVITGSTETMDVNTLPVLGARRSVFLSVRAASNGTYAMDFSELESFETYMDVLLVDHLTGTTTNLRNQASYTFQVTANPASQGTRRFEVIFNDARVTAVKPTVGGAALSAWPNPASADQHIMVSVSGSLTGAADLQVFDAAGRLMHTQQVTLTGDANQAYELGAQLAAGAYTVRCTTASATMSTRLVVNK